MSKACLLLAGILFIVWGCSSGGDPAAISVTLTPGSSSVHVNRSIRLSASVHNSTNTAVTWSLSGTGCTGAACGVIGSYGLYTAPGSVPSPATVTVKATSAADTSKSASATITILADVVVTVSPSNSLVAAGGTRQFTATVQNAVDNSVTWTVFGSGCTGSECGTISNTGLYTAPAVLPAASAVSITATSVEDTAVFGQTTTTIVEPISLEWTWISGSDTISQAGTYGTKGVPSPSNIPGARARAVSWLDSQGNLWLFGGYIWDWTHKYNDLWKFDPATLEWTWISGSDTISQAGTYGTKGVPSPSNIPGAREGPVSWIDSHDQLWLFGGQGSDSAGETAVLNDLWKFDPTTLEWTWISGSDIIYQAGTYGTKGVPSPSNIPGAREGQVSWIDSQGNLWLFGGLGVVSANDLGYLNDLWKFDPATLEWTWISGSDIIYQAGTYGTKGVPSPSNIPGAREGQVSWIDSQGNLWLFGGLGSDSAGETGVLNDLWKFDPTTLEWTWISGSNTVNQAGTYVTKGVPDPLNVPGGRLEAVSWIDPQGQLWLFGGENRVWGSPSVFNDLWKFDPSILEWTWVSGADSSGQGGVYGTKGVADPSNCPGAREWAVSWIDSQGNLWLFGGNGFDSEYLDGSLNDLWRGIR